MKTNAPWTDRTGNARSSLHTQSLISPGRSYGFTVAHGASYGIWLEVRFSGRYAVIPKTVASQGPAFMTTASKLFGAMFGGR